MNSEVPLKNHEFSINTFVQARSKTWFVESSSIIQGIPTLGLVSVEDDSQGETVEITLGSEIDARFLDPEDWSSLQKTKFEEPDRLGA